MTDDLSLAVAYDYDFTSYTDMSFDTEVLSTFVFDTSIASYVDVSGNSANFAIDVQAFGENTAVDLNLVAVATDGYSGITGAVQFRFS